ncbi:ABC transporter ATP-binding protein, partial [Porphyromonas loveana]|uniref:ABC transporter ATP-binding protein n=1 Tax=Porphyromonas loveana TaxID=1884669 RepID=UPI0035A08ABC
MPFLEANHIRKRYAAHTALDDVSISVQQGRVFGLLGPNGAGKTSLIRIINRITAPDEGEVLFDGRPMQAEDVRRIGYLPEERGLYPKMKVGEQAIYLARLKGVGKQEARQRLTAWFEKFDIMPWWDKKVEELSKGMQQKVQFVCTVIHEPELLIFDEPFSGFDPVNADLLKREILELARKGRTVIFSTHNMQSVEEVCDDFALINKSHVVLNGSVREVRR